MTDEKFDELLSQVARTFNQPPVTPKDEIWGRIQAVRKSGPPITGRPQEQPVKVVSIETRRRARTWFWAVGAVAAALVLGVAIGRISSRTATVSQPVVAAATDSGTSRRSETVMRFAAIEHLSHVEALLTDYETDRVDDEFRASARDLLSQTRLFLDANRLRDPRLRSLLEDLELVLVQISQLPTAGPREERGLINQGITERKIRTRLRDAIPAGPTA